MRYYKPGCKPLNMIKNVMGVCVGGSGDDTSCNDGQTTFAGCINGNLATSGCTVGSTTIGSACNPGNSPGTGACSAGTTG